MPGFTHWLRSAPIADPIDRRNAPVMQLLLLFYALLLPANWAWRLASGGEINEDRMLIFLVDMVVSALAVVSIVMIRRGRFRPAVMLFLAMQLISLELTFSMSGVLSQTIDPAPTMLTLVISGLVLGRRALWIAFGLLMLVFTTGFGVEIQEAIDQCVPISVALVNVPAVVISYSIITIILDRSIKALRESLDESNAHRSELQREMAERERTQAQLIHSQKMEATGRLASGIAHDFGNILGVIGGFASQGNRIRDIERREEQETAMLRAFDAIEDATARGTSLTRKLLAFSRYELVRPQSFDARQAIADMEPLLRQLLPRAMRLQLPDPDGPMPVWFDRAEFELMILNIATNAREAMASEGGVFRLALSRPDEDSTLIALSDTGHGMDAATRERIFEPFFSTRADTGGTGLGLSLIRDMILAGGGDISVTSMPGQGSTFRIRLPAVDAHSATASSPST
ncbi:ATP-binding protein [Lysobacter sp. KIS68-7]|uniref:sensor histidine kinase n=1 Tax=Lysobacter sp. KIS68-7 TaxID=2904252 RepID=UPI001E3AB212|nr:ATP-binding protein [Lysobacter sp. KIS68-7]UHQ19197.1 ATP-binding protein [Lysobacter sp. KIS68-7]